MFRHQVGALKQFAKTLESEVSTISSFIRSQPHKRAPTAFHSRLTISTSTRHSVSQLRPGSQSQLLLNPLFTRSFDPIDLSQSALTACQQCQRRYGSKKAKGSQGKSKPGKRNKQADADFDEGDLPSSPDELIDMKELEAKFLSHIAALRKEFAEKLMLRTNHSSYNTLPIQIEKNKAVPLQYIGQVTMKPPSTVVVNLASNPQYVAAVRNSLMSSALNVNPRVDGTTLFIETPRVTRERRETLAKSAKSLCHDTKQKIQHERTDQLKLIKAATQIFSMDDLRVLEKKVTEMATKMAAEAEKIMKEKQKELLQDS